MTGTGARPDGCVGDGVEVRLLGPFEFSLGGRIVELSSAKHRVLLAALALDAGNPRPMDELADLIWGDDQPDHPRRALQVCVTRLRKLLSVRGGQVPCDRIIATCADGYLLDLRPEQVDVGRFRHFLDLASRAGNRGDAEQEAAAVAEALAQWRGLPLAGVSSELLHRYVVPQLRAQQLQALERHFDIGLRRGRYAELAGELATLATRHPLHEKLWAQLMTALHGSGRRAEALAAYHTVRRRLADELGIDPGAELGELYATILAGRPKQVRGGGPAPLPVPRQLPADLPTFTGRARDLAELDALLAGRWSAAARIGVISGTAGVGKTALAVHWGRRVADRFPDGQLWVDLHGCDPGRALAPERALRRLLWGLGVADGQIPGAVEDQGSLYRSMIDGRQMLVVLDSASDAEQVRPLLPGAPGCLVLVTSRSELSGLVATEGARPLVVDRLTCPEARQLLARRLGAERIEAEPAAVDEIIGRCARLPRALVAVAARALAHPGSGLDTLAAALSAGHARLDARAGAGRPSERRGGAAPVRQSPASSRAAGR